MLDHAPTPAKNRDVETAGRARDVSSSTIIIFTEIRAWPTVQTRQATTHLDDDELS